MSTQDNFINTIGPIIQEEAFSRGYSYPSAIIAQACIESAYGKSALSAKYHNYFGLKCGSAWRDKSVNLTTKEEYQAGTLTTIKDNFRVYDNMQSGVIGYFDFISTKRYANLKNATSSRNYLELIKSDGYATSSKYVQNVYNVVEKYSLTAWDGNTIPTEQPIKAEASELVAALDIVAKYIIRGDFGNGYSRKENIYATLQRHVNKVLKGA